MLVSMCTLQSATTACGIKVGQVSGRDCSVLQVGPLVFVVFGAFHVSGLLYLMCFLWL